MFTLNFVSKVESLVITEREAKWLMEKIYDLKDARENELGEKFISFRGGSINVDAIVNIMPL